MIYKLMNIKRVPACVFVFCLFIPSFSFAGETVGVGLTSAVNSEYQEITLDPDRVMAEGPSRWHLRKSFSIGPKYDANISSDNSSGKTAWTTVLSPSLRLTRSGGFLKLDMTYAPSFEISSQTVSGNMIQMPRLFEQPLKMSGNYKFGRLGLSFAQSFLYGTAPATSELTGHTKTFREAMNIEAKYDYNKMALALVYQGNFLVHSQATLESYDYYEHSIGPRVYIHLNSKLDLYLSVDKDFVIYPSGTGDNSGASAYIGLKGRLNPKSSAALEGGIRQRTFQDGQVGDTTGFFTQGTWMYSLTPKIDLSLLMNRDIQMSAYQGVGFYRTASVSSGIAYRITPKIGFHYALSLRQNDYPVATEETDPDTGLTLSQKRKDNIVKNSLRIDYNIKRYVSVGLGYSIEERTSNFEEYDQHKPGYDVKLNIQF
jgi:hypothetical protein